MTTTQELLEASLRVIGAIDAETGAKPKELADSKLALNMMLSNWLLDDLIVWAYTKDTHTLAAGTESYTIGTGLTINTEAPYDIFDAFIRQSGKDYPIEIIGEERYNAIPNKSATGRPYLLWYEKASSGVPSAAGGTIYLYFSPNAADTLYLYSKKKLADITSLTADLTFPAGYEAAVKWNLALDLVPEFPGSKASNLTIKNAGDSLMRITEANSKQLEIPVRLDLFTSGGVYDGSSDTIVR